jgi:hypothetical protein
MIELLPMRCPTLEVPVLLLDGCDDPIDRGVPREISPLLCEVLSLKILRARFRSVILGTKDGRILCSSSLDIGRSLVLVCVELEVADGPSGSKGSFIVEGDAGCPSEVVDATSIRVRATAIKTTPQRTSLRREVIRY